MKKLYFCAPLIMILIGVLFFLLPEKKRIIYENQTASLIEIKDKKDKGKSDQGSEEITLMAVGDIMLDRGVEYMVKKYGSDDFKFPFLKIKDYLAKADILFGNLESIISDKGKKVGSIYSFRAEPEAMDGLVFAGFDIVSVANNHSFDYGQEAFIDSLERLKKANIEYVGGGFNEKEAFSLKIKEIKGTKIGFLAYSCVGVLSWRAQSGRPGIAFMGDRCAPGAHLVRTWCRTWLVQDLVQDIARAKEQVDILIVSLHWGEEYAQEPSPAQVSLANDFLKAGADIIIGHHSHVPEAVIKYDNNKWAAYSLGNFVFDQYFSKETMTGLLLEIIIENKKIKEVNQKEIKINQFYQPQLSTTEAMARY